MMLLAVSVVLAACGGGGSSTTSESSSSAEDGKVETTASTESGGGPVAAAEEVLAPYTGQPSPFPASEPLKKPLDPSTTIDYVACPTPICIENYKFIHSAGEVLGIHTKLVKAGASAQEIANAMDSVVADRPDGVVVAAIEVSLWHNQLEELRSDGAKVVTMGVSDAEEYEIEGEVTSNPDVEVAGKQLAAKAVTVGGPNTNVAFYWTPEIGFLTIMQKAFEAGLAEICPECTARYVKIPVTDIGSTAPTRIVSDLEANPETDVAVTGVSEIALGLPSAEKVAGIDVPRFGYGPGPPSQEYITNGEELAGISVAPEETTWSAMDISARLLDGQPLSPAEQNHSTPVAPIEWISKENLTAGQSFLAYPDYEARFKKLWLVK
ncbi:MAG: hypothetical protein BGO11_20500 [Solirubrobacterales bacterium 70-9]|nr:MAG: hypothetical protein BGO11_20500 [Solirubrobacterales bacterium 70-9]